MDPDREYANSLDEKAVSDIRALEDETGTTILAYMARPAPAQITRDQLKKLREIESRLGVRLVAYERS